MDKTWIKKDRWKSEYSEGVTQFLDFVSQNVSQDGLISCPCLKCVNSCSFSRETVQLHLLCNGINKNYSNWFFYGESISETSSSKSTLNHTSKDHDIRSGMHGMLNDLFEVHAASGGENEYVNTSSNNLGEESPTLEQSSRGPSGDAKAFFDLLKDASHPLYDGCKNFSTLSAIVTLLHAKCVHKWSNKSFTDQLDIMRRMLPADSTLPKDYYGAKKYLKDLGLGYEKIHACPNDCILFWKEAASYDECPKCHASRWDEPKEHVDDEVPAKKKKKPAKVLRWFPLKPRLQRLYMSSKTATLMKWHADPNGRPTDGLMRHPADSPAWKSFDSRYPAFSSDPRNVRLGLATDGFNPFGDMSTTYSIWPVILIIYNLPPWLCMKKEFLILSLIIPGKSSPGSHIDVYLQPLIEELNSLWEDGVSTYDVSTDETFKMRASLLWTINDFPAYGDLSGWSTKGSLACPTCNYDTHSRWLTHGGKYCYMRSRGFLPPDHKFRRNKVKFDGTIEKDLAPDVLSGREILLHTEGIECFPKGKRKRSDTEEHTPWKKRSILFQLPYWEHNLLRHNLDLMHTQKNVCDNVLGTVLNMKGKTKDNDKARMDLEEIGIRDELHLQKEGDEWYIPHASFVMTNTEKDGFLKVLKNVKVPGGYSSNLSRCIQEKQRRIIGMKSHDCHVLMQQLLPVALRGALPKKVVAPLIDLCSIFNGLWSKVVNVQDLEKLQSKCAETLCYLEQIFPPSFFTIMVHLVLHLPNEAMTNGPVQFRNMFPIERYLCELKSYVKNKAHPEGSIAEGYLAQECVTFCSRYLDTEETLFSKPLRTSGDEIGSVSTVSLDYKPWVQAHRYVLFNTDEINPFRAIHKESIKRKNRGSCLTEATLDQLHLESFVEWFKEYVTKSGERFTDKIKWLARGPNTSCRSFKRYSINGILFRTKDYEENKKTQNSGVFVDTEGDITYYGILRDIIELNYYDTFKHVIFKCDWADINLNKGRRVDEFGFTLVNFSRLMHTGARLIDEPFVLASQARQVFYVADDRNKNWLVPVKTKPRDVFDMGGNGAGEEYDDPCCDNEPFSLDLRHILENEQDEVGWSRNDVEGAVFDDMHVTDSEPQEQGNADESDEDDL